MQGLSAIAEAMLYCTQALLFRFWFRVRAKVPNRGHLRRHPFRIETNTDESEKSFRDARPSAMPSSADGASTACAMASNGHG